MKKTIKRLIGVSVGVIMFMCTVINGITANALGTYDAVVSISYPRPAETPQKPVITESGTEIEFLGGFWLESSTGYVKLYEHPVLT